MQITSFFAVAFATARVALGAPAGNIFARAGCNKGACVSSLASTVISCATAAAEEVENPLADLKCLRDAASSVKNFPAVCSQCLKDLHIFRRELEARSDTEESAEDEFGDEAIEDNDALD